MCIYNCMLLQARTVVLEFLILLRSLVLLISWVVTILASAENEFSIMFVKCKSIIYLLQVLQFCEILSGSFAFLGFKLFISSLISSIFAVNTATLCSISDIYNANMIFNQFLPSNIRKFANIKIIEKYLFCYFWPKNVLLIHILTYIDW